MSLTPEHDGRIIADITAEWATLHPEPFALHLTGPAGGHYVRQPTAHSETVEIDALEFCRALSGRGPRPGILRYALPL